MVGMNAKNNLFDSLELWVLDMVIYLLSQSTILRGLIRGISDVFSGKQKLLLILLIFASLILGILSGLTVSHVLPG